MGRPINKEKNQITLQISNTIPKPLKQNSSTQICESNEKLEPFIDEILPKKSGLIQYKIAGSFLTLYCSGPTPLFFEHRDNGIMPTLKFVHKYPQIWTVLKVDKGAIPYILGGANIMCGGLTSAGAEMATELEEGANVVIMAEGKEHAIAVGTLKMSTKDIKSKNKGVAVEVGHFLGDGLWTNNEIS